MEIKKLKVKDLRYAPYNPRKISDEMLEKLKRSIKEFGYVEPIIVNQRNMQVVGGNQRLKVLEDLGIEEVEAVIVDLDDAKEKTLNIALNKIIGEWDFPKLKDLFEELDTGEIDIELTGFDMGEIEDLMTQFHVDELEEIEGRENLSKCNPMPTIMVVIGRFISGISKEDNNINSEEILNLTESMMSEEKEFKYKFASKILDYAIKEYKKWQNSQ